MRVCSSCGIFLERANIWSAPCEPVALLVLLDLHDFLQGDKSALRAPFRRHRNEFSAHCAFSKECPLSCVWRTWVWLDSFFHGVMLPFPVDGVFALCTFGFRSPTVTYRFLWADLRFRFELFSCVFHWNFWRCCAFSLALPFSTCMH